MKTLGQIAYDAWYAHWKSVAGFPKLREWAVENKRAWEAAARAVVKATTKKKKGTK